jgi:hypothetical protein
MLVKVPGGVLALALSPATFVAVTLLSAAQAAPAFPGAQGAGAVAKGGRGGAVYQVTNLNDSGTGSLRTCVEASGPRTCVFRVAGTINLSRGFWIDDPYLTVAGQTAPGGGIQLKAKATTQSAVMIAAHNVVWRYTRVRHGYNSGGADNASNIMVFDGAYNVIVDHNSTSWNQDEGIGVWRSASGALHNVTVSWNVIAEALADHSTAIITGAEARTLSDGMTNLDFHHNLLMNDNHRNPHIKSKSGRIVNNLTYNTRFYYMQFGGGAQFDIISNVWKKGPLHGQVYASVREVQAFPGGNSSTANGTMSLYLANNTGFTAGTDQWRFTQLVSGENGTIQGNLSTAYRRASPLPAQAYPIRITSSDAILNDVGASRRLACNGGWIANRDATDQRLVRQYHENTGIRTLVRTEADVGGYPTIAAGTPCADADRDGMADEWERLRGFNPASAADRNDDQDGDGLTNLEEYLGGT